MSISEVLEFFEAHPQMAVGVVVGILVTAVWHLVIRRIKRRITTGVVMAVGGAAGTPFAHTLLQHLQ